jgi:hypothetical protein
MPDDLFRTIFSKSILYVEEDICSFIEGYPSGCYCDFFVTTQSPPVSSGILTLKIKQYFLGVGG